MRIARRAWRLSVSIAGVLLITYIGSGLIPANATTIGFAYLLLILVIASAWGFLEAGISSILATLVFNYFFFAPVGTFTIADPENWVALFSFLATALIASRLSAAVKRRALEAVEHEQDVERLYAFSRAILLIGAAEPFAKQLAQRLAEIFGLTAAVLYDRRSDEMYRAGPSDFDGMEDQLREAALKGTAFRDAGRSRVITAVRLGSDPIASLALQGALIPDSVLQSVANLVAIGLERAKAQELFHQVEATRQTERLRTTLIDAMAHEFKTPLTSIKAATTSLLSSPDQPESSRTELAKIADEEAERLKELIDDAVEMARLDAAQIDIQAERSDLNQLVQELIASMRTSIDRRPLEIVGDPKAAPILADRRLLKVAIKQLLDNALKYSPPNSPLTLRVQNGEGSIGLEITDHGSGIPPQEQPRIFQRFYRGPAVDKKIPGSGLGLSIAHRIAVAHRGNLTVTSRPGETTFRMTLPTDDAGAAN